ncbi:hypothetical protein A6R68_09921, partial [Neotoma lepida]
DMGLKVFTNSDIRKHKICEQPEDSTKVPAAYQLLGYSPVEDILETFETPKETIRKYFPETWIWDLVVMDSTGMAEIEMTAPDTITTWKARAFCLSSDTGLGLSPITHFQAFQPFFLELMMPYSVIRGEVFKLKAIVLNYLPTCIWVVVQLEASPDFLTTPLLKAGESHCVCMNKSRIVSWIVTPKSLGAKLSEQISLKLPPDVVKDSAQASFTVL